MALTLQENKRKSLLYSTRIMETIVQVLYSITNLTIKIIAIKGVTKTKPFEVISLKEFKKVTCDHAVPDLPPDPDFQTNI